MKKAIYFLLLILTVGNLHAQDAFFSNFDYSNALSNPAAIAISEDINLTLLHRSQWTSVVKPFSTSQFEASYPLRKANTNKKVAVFGLSFVNDRLGEGGYLTTNQIAFTGAYVLELGKNNFSVGAKVGYFNGGTDITQLQTGSQFVNGNYTSSANLGEEITNPIASGIEVSPSINFFQNDSMGINKFNIGVTAFNVNQPNTGRIVAGYSLPMRLALNAGFTQYFGALGIQPKALVMLQGNQNHVVLGADFQYYFQKTKEKYMGLALGGYYRMNDAGILSLKYLSNVVVGGISYDLNTSGLSDPLGKKTGSFEVFLNYRIRQESKVKQYFLIVNVWDKDTKEPIEATAIYLDQNKQKTDKKLFENASKSSTLLNQKEEYVFDISKEGYNPQELVVLQMTGEDIVKEIYLEKTIKTYELDLEILDKKTNQPVSVSLTLVNPDTGEETDLGTSDKLNTILESGKKHKIIAKADGYDDAILELNYDKLGTLSKTLYIEPELLAANLKLTVLDENTKQPIKSTIMSVCTEGPAKEESSVIALNNFPPEKYPLKIGNKFEVLISKEGYFNKSIKLEATKIEDIEKVVLLTPIEVGASIIIEDLLFKTGKTELDERSFRILDQLVDFMNQNPTVKIELQGHTDSDGSASSNQNLSEGRALSAVDYLVSKGISRTRMTSKGYGESVPIDTNATVEGKAKNRRVELKITGK